jgi:thiamine biosynthesis protein ThiS
MLQIKYFLLNGQCYYFNYNNSLLVLELNQSVYNKNKWHQTFIKNQDKVEIVSIVGGG